MSTQIYPFLYGYQYIHARTYICMRVYIYIYTSYLLVFYHRYAICVSLHIYIYIERERETDTHTYTHTHTHALLGFYQGHSRKMQVVRRSPLCGRPLCILHTWRAKLLPSHRCPDARTSPSDNTPRIDSITRAVANVTTPAQIMMFPSDELRISLVFSQTVTRTKGDVFGQTDGTMLFAWSPDLLDLFQRPELSRGVIPATHFGFPQTGASKALCRALDWPWSLAGQSSAARTLASESHTLSNALRWILQPTSTPILLAKITMRAGRRQAARCPGQGFSGSQSSPAKARLKVRRCS